MNLSKFVAEDVPLFLAMLGDLFPGISLPNIDRGELEEAIRDELVRLRCDVCICLLSIIIALFTISHLVRNKESYHVSS